MKQRYYDDDDQLTTAQAAAYLGLHVRTVQRLLNDTGLPGAKKYPRLWLIRFGDIKNYRPKPVGYQKTPQKA
jgi:excisionase family DNA binding protein